MRSAMASDDFCKIPVAKRPPVTWARFFKGLLFVVLFNFGCFMVHGTQLVFLFTLRWLPFQWARRLYNEGIRYTKGAFGCLLILMCEWFAPTKLSITFETEGKGKLSPDEIENIVTRNAAGEVERLNLPTKIVLISNHQVYADWWYAWCLLYFIGPKGVHRYIYITLKKSLKWLPVVGWGMQLYNFIFLARSWASDRVQLASHLSSLGKEAEEEDNPFCFLLYPEGTLVSPNTRPISKKFAEKTGVSDMTNILLPRSTGLHYSLRSLSPRVPELRLLDLTVVYPGIPPLGYGQDYYTLRSIFAAGVPPPVVHIHIRVFDVAKEVPIGDLTRKPTLSSGKQPDARIAEVDIPEQEKEVFDHWLRERWEEKDAEITNFLDKATFKDNTKPFEIPVRLRKKLEVLDAFCFFIPASVGYLWRKVRQ